MRLSRNPKQAGFTLVELLVVIAIVTVLAALLVPAVYYSIQTAKQARIGIELANIEKALERYKLEFGEYPPDFSELALLPNTVAVRAQAAETIIDAHLQRTFRRRLQTAGTPPAQIAVMDLPIDPSSQDKNRTLLATLNPTNALSFWLRGMGPDPTAPLFGAGNREPFFEFDASRLDTTNPDNVIEAQVDGASKIIAAPYYPAGSLDPLPYVYYRANPSSALSTAIATALASGGTPITPSASEPYRAYINAGAWATVVNNGDYTAITSYQVPSPYFSYGEEPALSNPVSSSNIPSNLYLYAAPKKFQLISAGLDGMFGVGGDWTTGIGNARKHEYNVADYDNITSFSEGKALEDLKDE